MNIFEIILRANEEYTSAIQALKDYLISITQENEFKYGEHTFEFNPWIEWDFVLTITEKETQESIDFSQFDEMDPVVIKKGLVTKEIRNVEPENIMSEVLQMLDNPGQGIPDEDDVV